VRPLRLLREVFDRESHGGHIEGSEEWLRAAQRAGVALNRMRWHRAAVGSSPLGTSSMGTSRTLYGYGLFDISNDPLVIRVPKFEGHAWSLHGHDESGRWWFRIGSQLDPPCRCNHLVVGPRWTGNGPAAFPGGDVARSSANFFGVLACLPLTEDTPDELVALQTFANAMTTTPLSQWRGESDAVWSTMGEVASRASGHAQTED
jgi:hypothetical protein